VTNGSAKHEQEGVLVVHNAVSNGWSEPASSEAAMGCSGAREFTTEAPMHRGCSEFVERSAESRRRLPQRSFGVALDKFRAGGGQRGETAPLRTAHSLRARDLSRGSPLNGGRSGRQIPRSAKARMWLHDARAAGATRDRSSAARHRCSQSSRRIGAIARPIVAPSASARSLSRSSNWDEMPAGAETNSGHEINLSDRAGVTMSWPGNRSHIREIMR
jgi:hypothetical protein